MGTESLGDYLMEKTDRFVLKIRTHVGFTHKAKLENNVISSLNLKC